MKTQYPEVRVVNGDRKKGAFCNYVINYKLQIRMSARCSGFVSNKTYSENYVYEARNRLLKKLKEFRI